MNDAAIVRFIKLQKLSWLGLLERIPDNRGVKEIIRWKLQARRRGRPRKRWLDEVETMETKSDRQI